MSEVEVSARAEERGTEAAELCLVLPERALSSTGKIE